jgi:hypothetical protein
MMQAISIVFYSLLLVWELWFLLPHESTSEKNISLSTHALNNSTTEPVSYDLCLCISHMTKEVMGFTVSSDGISTLSYS